MTTPLPRRPPHLTSEAAARRRELPETFLQFGEGNFLRAFVDWMLERMNRAGLLHAGVVAVQPIPDGKAPLINEQDGLYTVALRGIHDGGTVDTRELVSAVTRCVDPYADPSAFLELATNPVTRFVVSNTTEAGIRIDPADTPNARPAHSFPGKLTQLLHERFRHFHGDPARGWVMLPCELVERNGDALRQAVTDTATRWKLSPAFLEWLGTACIFTNTLVDRIVTGYPAEDAARIHQDIGWDDRLLVAAEPYHSWVIESPRPLEAELPLLRAGLEVVWTADVTPYRERKVRILNGAHTLCALVGHLAGLDTVADCMADDQLRTFLEASVSEEIVPTLLLPPSDLAAFMRSVFERFRNPFLRHRLLDISLNSTSKFRTRLLPALQHHASRGPLPSRLTVSLAALLVFFRADTIADGALACSRDGAVYPGRDEPVALQAFRAAWSGRAHGPLEPAAARDIVRAILGDARLWGEDLTRSLPGIDVAVSWHVAAICSEGIRDVLARV